MEAAVPLFTAAEMRAADRRAMDELGVPGLTLMERAGREAWRVIRRELASWADARPAVVMLAGRGNNGGDGLVVARLAHAEGFPVRVLLLSDPDALRGDAAAALRAARGAGVAVESVTDGQAAGVLLADRLEGAAVAVDALLGTGMAGAPRGAYAAAVSALNAWRAAGGRRRVVALDVPSGLDPDTGAAPGEAVRADVTVTFGGLKLGLVMGPARAFTGVVHLVDIGLPASAYPAPRAWLTTADQVRAALPEPPFDTHKGGRGRVWLLAGSRGMTGAAVLAARGALRGGAGLVHAAVPAGERLPVAVAVPEALTLGLPEGQDGRLAAAAGPAFLEAAAGADALVLGPGLGTGEGVRRAVIHILNGAAAPAVVDADALNALSALGTGRNGSGDGLSVIAHGPGPRVLTPHPGEAARLLGCSAADVQRDRPGAARELAGRSRAVVLLKGARSLVADPDGRLWVIPTGSPALATGGTGDVLAGLVGALLAQGLAPAAAARCGAFLHGWAGQLLAGRLGETGVVAGDLPEAVARVRARLRRGGGSGALPAACGIILDGGDAA